MGFKGEGIDSPGGQNNNNDDNSQVSQQHSTFAALVKFTPHK